LTWNEVWAKLKAPLLSVALTIIAVIYGKKDVIELSVEVDDIANTYPCLVC
jgi:hypothetical protein